MSPLRECVALIVAPLLALAYLAGGQQPSAGEQTAPVDKQPARTDLHGDPLPPGALARLGTLRWRQTDRVSGVAFSPDGKLLASASGNGRIHLWDVPTGKQVLDLDAHVNEALAFSPDGKLLASEGVDYTVRLWDVATGRELHRLQGGGGDGRLAFSPDGKVLASTEHDEAAYDRVIHLWDTATGKELRQLLCGRATITSIAFSPDGKALVSGHRSGRAVAEDEQGGKSGRRESKDRAAIRLWDVATGKQRGALGGERPDVCSVAFLPDGKVLAAGGYDKRIRLWEVGTGKELGHYDAADPAKRPAEEVRARGSGVHLVLAADGKTLVSTCEDRTVLFWGVEAGTLIRRRVPTIHSWPVALSPDGRLLAAPGGGPAIPLWDAATGQALQLSAGHVGGIYAMSFSPDGKVLASAGGDIRLWDPATAKELRRLPGSMVAAFSPDGKVLACGSPDYTLRLCDPATGRELRRVPASDSSTTCPRVVAFSPDSKLLATESSGSLGLWEVATGKPSPAVMKEELNAFIRNVHPMVTSLAFSPDGRMLACAARHDALRLWQMAPERAYRTLEQTHVKSVAFSPDSKLLAAADGRHPKTAEHFSVRVWEAATGQEWQRLADAPQGLRTVAFSPDGKTLAAGGDDGIVRLWEVATGQERLRLAGHRKPVQCIAFSPDGTILASGSEDTTALTWDLTGRLRRGKPEGVALAPEELEGLWADLAGADAAKAYRAIWTLAAAPQPAVVPFLGKRLHVIDPADAQRLARLIADLDDNRFAVREKASAELEKLGWGAEPVLRKALAGAPSVELRQRAEALLMKLKGNDPSPALLRSMRAVEVLELVGNPEGRLVLDRLAKEVPTATLSEEAKAALQRLARRAIVSP